MTPGGVFDPARLKQELADQERFQEDPNFWNQKEHSQKVLSTIRKLRAKIDPWEELVTKVKDLDDIYKMALEEKDESMTGDLEANLKELEGQISKMKILELLSEENDMASAFVNIHAGAGGTESCDWASMLMRMYIRWGERRKYKVDIVDILEAEGGVKSVSLEITGVMAYGYLRSEAGVHRLVRISPFDSNSRRHTSFVSVEVTPVIDDDIEVDIKDDDIRIDTYRAQGAGGQHVNKTDSAVRITHFPSGVVVQCQNERSQHKNKDLAFKMLRSRLYDYYKAKQDAEKLKNSPQKKAIEWGSQIRSYVFQPYTMVKDHRTKFEMGNVQAVMDGDIDGYMEEYLKWIWLGCPDRGASED